MKKWFVIRADTSLKIGIGHIMRCMAIAEWALDYDFTAVLITRELPEEFKKHIKLLKASIRLLPHEVDYDSHVNYVHSKWLPTSEKIDAEQTEVIIKHELLERGYPPSFIIVDHYALAAPWEKKITKFSPVLCIDDLNDRPHHCRWLIDQTFNKTNEDYNGLINENCELFIGTDFALLRKEFKIHKHTNKRTFPSINEEWQVLITLGGIDESNVTGVILKLLTQTKLFHRMNITIIIGSENPNIEELTYTCSKHPERFKLLVDVKNMSDLMLKSNLCIGAAGSTSWERCAMSLPTLMVVIADNQLSIAEKLNKYNVCFNMGKAENLNLQHLENNLLNIMTQPDVYRIMVNNSYNVCDGMGCNRILNILMRE